MLLFSRMRQVGLVVAVLLAAVSAGAQQVHDGGESARGDSLARLARWQRACASAARIARTVGQQRPGSEDEQEGDHQDDGEGAGNAVLQSQRQHDAVAQLLTCGPRGGIAIAGMIRGLRTETDTAVLNRMVGGVGLFRDASVLRASLDVAADRGASTPARIAALLNLTQLRNGRSSLMYDQMLGDVDDTFRGPKGRCGSGTRASDDTPHWYAAGAALPADFHQQIKTLARRMWDDASEPLHVRTASSCAMLNP